MGAGRCCEAPRPALGPGSAGTWRTGHLCGDTVHGDTVHGDTVHGDTVRGDTAHGSPLWRRGHRPVVLAAHWP